MAKDKQFNTRTAFSFLCEHWSEYNHPNKESVKTFKWKFLNNKPVSPEKMKEILLGFNFKIKSELTWSKPKIIK